MCHSASLCWHHHSLCPLHTICIVIFVPFIAIALYTSSTCSFALEQDRNIIGQQHYRHVATSIRDILTPPWLSSGTTPSWMGDACAEAWCHRSICGDGQLEDHHCRNRAPAVVGPNTIGNSFSFYSPFKSLCKLHTFSILLCYCRKILGERQG